MAPAALLCISGTGEPRTDTSGVMAPALATASLCGGLSSVRRQMAEAAREQRTCAECSLTFEEEEMRTETRRGTPPASAHASWLMRDLYARAQMAVMVFSFACADDEDMRASSGGTPPASTIDVRLSVESRARFAKAAAACSCALRIFAAAAFSASCFSSNVARSESLGRSPES